jgi:hypothetical protein
MRMSAPEGYTQDEWDGLTEGERAGILGEDEPTEAEQAALEQIAAKEEGGETKKEEEEQAPTETVQEEAAKAEEDREKPVQQQAVSDPSQKITGLLTRIDELQAEEADEFLENGNSDKRKELLKEINAANREIAKEEMRQENRQETAQIQAADQLQKVVAQSITAYPFLDDKAAQANKPAIAEVVSTRDLFFAGGANGMTMAQALMKAVELVAPKYSPAEPVYNKGERPKAELPKIKTLGKLPQASEEDTGKDPYAAIDALEGDEYEETLAKMKPDQLAAYMKSH